MARGGIPNKLRSVFKKLNSFGSRSSSSLGRQNTISPTFASSDDECPTTHDHRTDLRPVFVGKARRRYLVGADVVHHPLFRELVDRSGGDSDTIAVSCEVVMFEHLLWMLENADDSMDGQLVDFYAC